MVDRYFNQLIVERGCEGYCLRGIFVINGIYDECVIDGG